MSDGNSNIATLLDKILKAIYGKDVRQSIHDAIQQCYEDVGDPTLNEAAFKKAVNDAIADGSIAALTIGDGSIQTEHLKDKSVTKEKLADEIVSEIDGGASQDAILLMYELFTKCAFTENVSSTMGQLDTLLHEGMLKITKNISNATLSNGSSYVKQGHAYSATVTANLGYKLSSVTVSMGNSDITSTAYNASNRTISISSVTGEITINVTAVESAYTSLKYLQSDGASWIDTGVIPDVNHRYEMGLMFRPDHPYTVNYYFAGADQYNVGSAYKQMIMFMDLNGTKVHHQYNGAAGGVGSWNKIDANFLDNKEIYYVAKNGEQNIYFNSELTIKPSNYDASTSSFGSPDTMPIIPMYLFTVNYASTIPDSQKTLYDRRSTVRIYYFKVYNDTTGALLHNFIPVAKGSELGFYDTVDKTFHGNIGTGTFSYEEA